MFKEMFIQLNGKKSLTIENYKNILDYRENLILIQGKTDTVKLTGKDFAIDYFTHESMGVTGTLEKVEFLNKGKS